jgi:hypothetical protein
VREDSERWRRLREEFEEEEAGLPVPASPARVAPGLVAAVSGFLFAGFAGDSWRALLGMGIMVLSPAVMLRWPKK